MPRLVDESVDESDVRVSRAQVIARQLRVPHHPPVLIRVPWRDRDEALLLSQREEAFAAGELAAAVEPDDERQRRLAIVDGRHRQLPGPYDVGDLHGAPVLTRLDLGAAASRGWDSRTGCRVRLPRDNDGRRGQQSHADDAHVQTTHGIPLRTRFAGRDSPVIAVTARLLVWGTTSALAFPGQPDSESRQRGKVETLECDPYH